MCRSGWLDLRSVFLVLCVLPSLISGWAAASPYDIAVDRDAKGDWLAVSAYGDAEASRPFCSPSLPGRHCVALAISGTGDAKSAYGCRTSIVLYLYHCLTTASVSGTGNSEGQTAISGSGDARATGVDWCRGIVDCVAVSGTGNASGDDASLSILGASRGPIAFGAGTCNGRECFAINDTERADGYWASVSTHGNASRCPHYYYSKGYWCGLVAVGGGGDAWGQDVGISRNGTARGDALAVSGTGDALWGQVLSLSGFGTARGSRAVSLTGDAFSEGCNTVCDPTLAASATGNASGGDIAVSGTGDAKTATTCRTLVCVPPVAISGTGHANGMIAVSGCDTLLKLGRPEGCRDETGVPRLDGILP